MCTLTKNGPSAAGPRPPASPAPPPSSTPVRGISLLEHPLVAGLYREMIMLRVELGESRQEIRRLKRAASNIVETPEPGAAEPVQDNPSIIDIHCEIIRLRIALEQATAELSAARLEIERLKRQAADLVTTPEPPPGRPGPSAAAAGKIKFREFI
jgi:hypothetical protein